MEQSDVDTAYLYGILKQEIWMKLPPGFERGRHHALLKCCLYGLKQNDREWYSCIRNKFISMGFIVSSFDPCVFIYGSTNIFFIFFYVDDLLFFGKFGFFMQHIKDQISCDFSYKDLGKAKYILGFEVNYSKDPITLSQQAYAKRIFQRFGMDDCRATKIFLPPNTFSPRGIDEDIINQSDYQQRIGSLGYLAIGTRLDFAQAVNQLRQYSNCFTNEHHYFADYNLRYFSGTQNHSILFQYCHLSLQKATLPLYFYADASFAPDPDTQRSIGGFIHLLLDAFIS